MLKLKDDLGRQRPRQGLKGPKGHRQCNQCTHTHTNTLRRQGQRQSRVGATRRGLVRYLRLQQLLLLLLPHRIPKREPSPAKKKKRRQSRRKKLASFIIILYLFFFVLFQIHKQWKKVYFCILCVRDGAGSRAQHLRPVL